ncbi:cold-shock protein [Franconibacter daqui]|uniref:Cold-shock protein n=2 Tax=Enterobacteriaceae TaxID=543 RepID=A0ABV1PMB6_9ENTR|nr:cold-shock protein [Franconibacter pulveris]
MLFKDATKLMHFKCPCCQGSQYRTSHFDVSEKNPYGAKCIFCKSNMQVSMQPTEYKRTAIMQNGYRAAL